MKHHSPVSKTLIAAALVLTLSGPANADPGFMLGISHNFGGATGITFKLLSTDRKDRAAVALGLSYFPGQGTRSWGLDTSVGYTLQRGAVTLGYDWFNEQIQLGLGGANTRSRTVAPAPAPQPEVTAPAPAPKPPAKKPPKKPAPAPAPAAEVPAPTPAPAPEPAPTPAPAPEPAPAPTPAPAPAPAEDPCARGSAPSGKATVVCSQ